MSFQILEQKKEIHIISMDNIKHNEGLSFLPSCKKVLYLQGKNIK